MCQETTSFPLTDISGSQREVESCTSGRGAAWEAKGKSIERRAAFPRAQTVAGPKERGSHAWTPGAEIASRGRGRGGGGRGSQPAVRNRDALTQGRPAAAPGRRVAVTQ
ncbi:hypothetical protein R5R35_006721 [Gryllus longicercus]|uniref:Uncharacterized protein n=1 Tax=Gryllus longicercus TaxID=2509291 RepID=A0AAN9ZGN9_9ORTH